MSQMDANFVVSEVAIDMGKFLEAMKRSPPSKNNYREARQYLLLMKATVEQALAWFDGGWLDETILVSPPTEASPTFPCLLFYQQGQWHLRPKPGLVTGIYSKALKDFLGTMTFSNCEDMVKYGITTVQAGQVFSRPEYGPMVVQYRLRPDEEIRPYPEMP